MTKEQYEIYQTIVHLFNHKTFAVAEFGDVSKVWTYIAKECGKYEAEQTNDNGDGTQDHPADNSPV